MYRKPSLKWREVPVESAVGSAAPFRLGALDYRTVYLYRLPLEVSEQKLKQTRAELSDDENDTAARFHFERHRRRYIVCRGTLRRILSAFVGVPPKALCFEAGPYGKPRLAACTGCAHSEIEFNVSHSDELALIAVTSGRSVGIDLERVRRLNDFDELVTRFFSKRESELFVRLPESEKPLAFFQLWTRKEALLKATGDGIGQYLHQVEIGFLPGEEARILAVPAPFGRTEDWELHHLDLGGGFVGAIALRSLFESWQ